MRRRFSSRRKDRQGLGRCLLNSHSNSTILKLVRMGEDKPSPLLWTSLRSRWSKELESMLRGSPLHFMWEQRGVQASALPN